MIKNIFILVTMGTMINFLHAKPWHNWANTQQCNPTIITPSTVQELITIIEKAKKEGAKVHAVGSGHSWSDIVCMDGYLINTNKLNKIISVDQANKQVTVQAGIKLYDLNEQLAQLGLCLSNQGAITKQSLAGVVSTATHGSGKTGTFASFITKVQLLTADGKLLTISETENSELFGAARTSIGSLGIMTELTVQCEPLFMVQQEKQTSTWSSFAKNYKDLLNNNDYMQSYCYANDNVEILMHNRVTPEEKNNQTVVQKISNKLPFLKNTDYSYTMLSGTLWAIYMEEEIAIPLSRFVEAANAARALIQEQSESSRMFDGILFRFVSGETQNYLSPATDRDVVFFSITTASRSGYEPFYKKFYDLMLQYNGRPHWGKINYLTKADAQKLYGGNFEKFIGIRKKLDPNGMFSNAFTKRIFGW